jgi:hypothetical protein
MQSTKNTHGVLIADVVESRSHSHLRSSLNEKLRIASIAQLDDKLIRVPYAVTAGDEFQTIALRVDSIPQLILDLRRRLQPLQLRIAIGIGTIQGTIRPPANRIAGQAFESARAAISEIKETRKYPTGLHFVHRIPNSTRSPIWFTVSMTRFCYKSLPNNGRRLRHI